MSYRIIFQRPDVNTAVFMESERNFDKSEAGCDVLPIILFYRTIFSFFIFKHVDSF